MSTVLEGSNIEVPTHEDITPVVGGYTGFNGTDLQQIYCCRSQPARRSQIARGWGKPVIQRLADNDLVATGYLSLRENRNPRYPKAYEEAALFFSQDAGESWSEPRLLNVPGRASQFSVLSDGVMILAAQDADPDSNRLYRSTDRGETFQEVVVAWDDFVTDRRPGARCMFGETNGVLELADGTLLMVCNSGCFPIEHYTDFQAYLIRSTDRGKTWTDASFILEADEVELLLLPDDRLLAFVRVDTAYTREVFGTKGLVGEGGDQMVLMESTDLGRSWSDPKPIGLTMSQIPGFPLLLPDGRLVLIYGNRQFPFGCQAIASRDFGKTWDLDNFIMLAYASWDNYGGHPRSILMPDGTIITGYYAHYFKSLPDPDKTINADLVSHCLAWRPPDNWP